MSFHRFLKNCIESFSLAKMFRMQLLNFYLHNLLAKIV